MLIDLARDMIGLFVERLEVRTTDEAGREQFLRIERARDHKARKLVKFAGVDSVEQAEGLRSRGVWLRRAQVGPLEEGRWFVQDIVGIDVYTDEGEHLGTLAEVMHMPANDVYVVRGGGGEILLPVIEQVVLAVDVPNGRMVVHLMEGLR